MTTLQNHFWFGPVYIWKLLTSKIKQIPSVANESTVNQSGPAYSCDFPTYGILS